MEKDKVYKRQTVVLSKKAVIALKKESLKRLEDGEKETTDSDLINEAIIKAYGDPFGDRFVTQPGELKPVEPAPKKTTGQKTKK